jgi:anti-anti-sigma factor
LGALEIEVEQHENKVVIRLGGEFDISGVREFMRTVGAAVNGDGKNIVCVDLRKLSFIGASGLRCLIDLQAQASREGKHLILIKGTPLVHRVFEMTGVDKRIVIVDDPAYANGKDPAI